MFVPWNVYLKLIILVLPKVRTDYILLSPDEALNAGGINSSSKYRYCPCYTNKENPTTLVHVVVYKSDKLS